jgi:hypothetical protein
LPALVAVLLFLLTGMSTVMADQFSISYVDSSGSSQTLVVDTNSSTADLALAAALLDEVANLLDKDGVDTIYNSIAVSGSLVEIAAAMAAAAPVFAASVAEVMCLLSPDEKAAIVAAINAVPGVNTAVVLAAVEYIPPYHPYGPRFISLEFTQTEPIPSKN